MDENAWDLVEDPKEISELHSLNSKLNYNSQV